MNRVPLIACAAVAVFAAAAGYAVIQLTGDADAGGAGSMTEMRIDMDITGNAPTTVGTIETCKRINENDTQDADESAVDTLTFDVLAIGIPAQDPYQMIGFEAYIAHNESALTVTANNTTMQMIGALPGSSAADSSDAAPDNDPNGFFKPGAFDAGPFPASSETGSGVLARVSIASDSGAAAGQYPLTFPASDPASVHLDTDANAWVPSAKIGATIAIDEPCGGATPPPPTDTPTPLPSGVTPPPPTDTPTPTPTPTPTGPTPTPCVGVDCPSETPVPTPTPTPVPTPTPTPCVGKECPTATPTPVPTPTPTEGPTIVKGDLQCDGDVDSVDALMALRHIADLSTTQEPGCPEIGSLVARGLAGAGTLIFGDINCNSVVEAVDPLFILRHVADLNVNLPAGCDLIGE